MKDSGEWWYDRRNATGATGDPSDNADMISPLFWMVTGKEFKITRSDDPSHTALLQTTGNCLGKQTFRSKITSYGNFRNGKVWSKDRCLGSCTVQYGGQYRTTEGFEAARCDGRIATRNKISFWCDWGDGDGSVMMIGGGGGQRGRNGCPFAFYGIGTTEANAASFVDQSNWEKDFGTKTQRSYSLNLWISQ